MSRSSIPAAVTPAAHRPFLKWAGNKFSIRDQLRQLLPVPERRLIEPFTGAAALFLNSDYPRYRLSDSNPDLITLYQHLSREGAPFIETCRALFCDHNNQRERYYALREEFNHTPSSQRRAALFLYLNRHGYNGLCRYNRRGIYNVPFGAYRQPYFPAREMAHFHHRSQLAQFHCEDFVTAMRTARRGDVIYCDPPYVPLSATASFTHYRGDGFNLQQQQQLADEARRCAQRGIPVLISNHALPITRELYQGAQLQELPVARQISCIGSRRQPVQELLALFR